MDSWFSFSLTANRGWTGARLTASPVEAVVMRVLPLYGEKLKDPRWQRVRLRVFERADWKCEHCGATDRELQVHHFAYLGKEPWETPDWLLRSLCRDCHEAVPKCSCDEHDCTGRRPDDCGEKRKTGHCGSFKWCDLTFDADGHCGKCECSGLDLCIPIRRRTEDGRAVIRPPWAEEPIDSDSYA